MSKKVSGWPLIVPKEVDTSITGDQVMEALAADVEASDSGKVLTATYSGLEGEETGSVVWASPLPIIGEGDAGKVLTVNAGETGAEWAAASGGSTLYYTRHKVIYDNHQSIAGWHFYQFNMPSELIGKRLVSIVAEGWCDSGASKGVLANIIHRPLQSGWNSYGVDYVAGDIIPEGTPRANIAYYASADVYCDIYVDIITTDP